MAGREWSDADFGGLPSVLVAAHELKTPLSLIRQLTLMLGDDLTSEADKKQIQQRIVQTSEQALQLTVDLANSANLTPSLFPLEPVNPLAICQQMAAETRFNAVLYGRKISWPRSGRNSRLILANRTLLGRILANFLNNALKYTEDGSEIKVSVTAVGGAVRLSVRDFGPMMGLKEYRRLLDEMDARKTVRTRPESSGLGIYVASQFAQAMNGQIGLIRHRDGLTFYVDMPISRQLSLL
ncbi:HAMP domain-containing sensor histidine kinase [Candidatus Nanosynbacter sp. TM7-074]|uniref:HAMP domain-containing sensor histidine kinase n=1 Tax=Candidatus Nanosynbacter sp. TM7-074 TaxID=3158573 RepID=A0AB39J971_9BACT